MKHEITIRVYYEDTDAGGIVFYGNYLKFLERGRTEFLRSLGFQNTDLQDRFGIFFVVRRLEADYLKSSRLDDSLRVVTELLSCRNTSFTMRQSVFRGDEMIFDAQVLMVCVGENVKPVRIPDVLREIFEKGLEEAA